MGLQLEGRRGACCFSVKIAVDGQLQWGSSSKAGEELGNLLGAQKLDLLQWGSSSKAGEETKPGSCTTCC